MKTYMAKGETVERKWYVVDATDMILGRLSSQVAAILRGKNKPIFTPHVDTGDCVIIVNAAKVRLTGNKLAEKTHIHHTGYPGGIKEVTYGELLSKKPEFAVYESIRRMMPKGPLGRKMLKKLRIYAECHRATADDDDLFALGLIKAFHLIIKLTEEGFFKLIGDAKAHRPNENDGECRQKHQRYKT